MSAEWQAANGSATVHLIDTEKPAWHKADGSRRRNGPRSECGRYPQRNADGIWWSFPADEFTPSLTKPNPMNVKACPDCLDLVTTSP